MSSPKAINRTLSTKQYLRRGGSQLSKRYRIKINPKRRSDFVPQKKEKKSIFNAIRKSLTMTYFNLTDLYEFAERGRIGTKKLIKLIDCLYFKR